MKSAAISIAVRQGPRNYQEDRHFYMRLKSPHFRGWLLAVMDGHRGKSVAELCAQEIGNLFKLSDPYKAEEALRNLISALHAKTAQSDEGTTISVACILESHRTMSIAVLGDSPVIVLDNGGMLHCSPEHNVRLNSAERISAEKRGGTYEGGYIYIHDGDLGPQYGLQMSRCLGDAQLGKILSREPEIYTIADPQWVLVASDGLFDSSHCESQELAKEIRKYAKKQAAANDLMKWAIERELADNATALVWRSQRKK